MNEDRYVAAIEISSSKIVGVAGLMHSDGHLEILCAEEERHTDGVRHGHIQNLDEISRRAARIIERLEKNPRIMPKRIKRVFMGLGGRSLRAITTDVSMQLSDDTEITSREIENLRSQALSTAIDNTLEIIDAVDRIYVVGKNETHTPVGSVGNRISATYDLVVARPELKRNIIRSISDKLGIEVSFVVTNLACGKVILTDEEKRLGCMLVDIGAETTTVSIYRRGYTNYLATLPLGGRNITLDLTTLNLLEEKAEEIKITSGNAIMRDNPSTLNINGLKLSDISAMIVARSEEIVANIVEQIEYAGFSEKDLPQGIICIGGGSRLPGMVELISRQSGLPARQGQLPSYIRIESSHISNSSLMEGASILYAGASSSDVECFEEPTREEIPVTGDLPEFPDEIDEENEKGKKRGKKQKQNRGWQIFKDSVVNFFVQKEQINDDLDMDDSEK